MGTRWLIRNGESINFWQDNWTGHALLHSLIQGLFQVRDLSLKVKDAWDPHGNWHLTTLSFDLPNHVCDIIQATPKLFHSSLDDLPSWNSLPNGSFDVRSAYLLASNSTSTPTPHTWKWLWKTPTVMAQPDTKKKKKKNCQMFGTTWPPPTPFVPYHSIPKYLFSLFGRPHILYSSFLLIFSQHNTHTPLTHSPTGTLHTTIHSIFPARSSENSLRISKASSFSLFFFR